MKRSFIATLAYGLATATTLGLLSAPAHAGAQTSRQDGRPSNFVLTVTPGGSREPAAVARLMCEPPGGDHPKPVAACHALAAAAGDFTALRGRQAPCPMLYAPVTAAARGMWQGRSVSYRETFPNKCVMLRQRGVVFDF